jgi:hypothetical protein
MKLLAKWFKKQNGGPQKRVRICVECGMPVGEHKDWCAIRRDAARDPRLARAMSGKSED